MLDFYRDRAAECARDAAATQLPNVRERFRRSEEAWLSMAARLEGIGEHRLRNVAAHALNDQQGHSHEGV